MSVPGMVPHVAVDVNTFVGAYPFRYLPHPDPDVLVRVLDREGIAQAWVGHLPSVHYRDPSAGNTALYGMLEPFGGRLRPVPAIRPDWPGWRSAIDRAAALGAAAVRVYPAHWQLGAHDKRLAQLAVACGEAGLPLVLTVRLEDARQRHPLDVAGELEGAVVRALARAGAGVRLIVTGAGKGMIEEVHWGLTPEEQRRVLWDISWIWGPPEDHLATLIRTIGAERLVFGSQWPLRLVQAPIANLELLPDDLASIRLADVGTFLGG